MCQAGLRPPLRRDHRQQQGSTPLCSGAGNKPLPQVAKPVTIPPCSGLGQQRGRSPAQVPHEGTRNAEIVAVGTPEHSRTVQTVKLRKVPRQPRGWREGGDAQDRLAPAGALPPATCLRGEKPSRRHGAWHRQSAAGRLSPTGTPAPPPQPSPPAAPGGPARQRGIGELK